MSAKKWYDKKAAVIILLILFFPVGLYALWKGNSFGKNVKIVLTCVVGVLVLISIAGNSDTGTVSTTTTLQRDNAATQNTSARADTRQGAPQQKTQKKQPKGVSRQTYDAIRTGMTREQLISMLGRPGMQSETQTPGFGTTQMMQWQSAGFTNIKTIQVFLQNGKVVDKTWMEM
jgi:hypothetical protein